MIGNCRAQLQKLTEAEGTPKFEAFKELIMADLTNGLSVLLWNWNLSEKEEHEMLTRLRTYILLLDFVPGEKLNLQQQIINLIKKNDDLRERKFAVANAKTIRRWNDSKRRAEMSAQRGD